jgi:hypothetical protein
MGSNHAPATKGRLFMEVNMSIVYVRVIENGSIGYEPVNAIKIKDNVYKLIDVNASFDPIYNPWEFPPDSLVICELAELTGPNEENGMYLLAQVQCE